MPTIESRKTGEAQYVDMETFKNLERIGHIRHFVIIDDSDLEPVTVTESKKLIDFSEIKESPLSPKKIYSRDELDEKTVKELKIIYDDELKKLNKDFDLPNNILKKEIIDLILLEPLKDEKQKVD